MISGLSDAALRIVERAIRIRINSGETVEDAVNYYTKLSDKQKKDLIDKLSSEYGSGRQ